MHEWVRKVRPSYFLKCLPTTPRTLLFLCLYSSHARVCSPMESEDLILLARQTLGAALDVAARLLCGYKRLMYRNEAGWIIASLTYDSSLSRRSFQGRKSLWSPGVLRCELCKLKKLSNFQTFDFSTFRFVEVSVFTISVFHNSVTNCRF